MSDTNGRPVKAKPPRWALWLPLALFAGFAGLAGWMLLHPADPTIESKLVGKPMPAFDLPPALAGRPGLNSKILANGKPHLVNVFASWCVPCRVEAPQLGELAKAGIPIEGISVRDTPENLQLFLQELGDPYQRIGADDDGKVQLALGSSGVPETYVVDGQGKIVYQHVGEIRPEHLGLILEKLQEAGE